MPDNRIIISNEITTEMNICHRRKHARKDSGTMKNSLFLTELGNPVDTGKLADQEKNKYDIGPLTTGWETHIITTVLTLET
jgi:hypothetical protein